MQTDSSFQKDLKTYKNEIKSKLICDSKVSKKFFEDLQNNIDNYIVENNAKSIEEIYKHFGTADDIAKAFFETTDIDTVKRKISIKKLIVILVIAIISIFAIVMIFVGIDATQKNVAYEIQDISDAESIYFIEE